MPGVECLGFVDKTTGDGAETLHDLYRRASVFVLPSYNEAAGNVFVEAMAHKVPCIGADCCAMPEIIVDSQCGDSIGRPELLRRNVPVRLRPACTRRTIYAGVAVESRGFQSGEFYVGRIRGPDTQRMVPDSLEFNRTGVGSQGWRDQTRPRAQYGSREYRALRKK